MAAQSAPHAYGYLTHQEVRFLDAAVDRLIPPDALGPGAREAGVTCYIDGALCSVWGTHGRNYRSGPWRDGTPQQGYQSRLTPQEVYRAGIREINALCGARHGKAFENLAHEQQDAVLRALEQGEIELESLSGKLFFDLLLRNTEEGFFADPMYGGNRGKAGWKLLGFPGVASGAYREHLDDATPYRAESVSILDIETQQAQVDAQGFAKHIMIRGQ